jgi:hypothetical protein
MIPPMTSTATIAPPRIRMLIIGIGYLPSKWIRLP